MLRVRNEILPVNIYIHSNNEIPKLGTKKLAILSNRFLNEDQRGSEEFPKQLFKMLGGIFTVDVLTSDIIDHQPLTSPLSHRTKEFKTQIDKFSTVYRFKSHPLISSSAYVASLFLSKFDAIGGENIRYLSSILYVLGWGPLTPKIYEHISLNEYDVILGSTFPSTPSYFAYKASRNFKIPFVYAPYFHYRLANFANNKILKIMVKNSTAVIARTESEKKKLILLGACNKKSFVIPSLFDLKFTDQYRVNKAIARERLGLKDEFVILTVPHPLKGGVQTLEAAADVSENLEGICVISMGNVNDTYRKIASKITKRYKNLRVIDFGWVSTEMKYMINSAADIFSMPSITDAFGLSYLDSWSCQTPVIGAKNTSADDLILNGKNGYLVSFGNIGELSSLFKELYFSKQLLEAMGRKGYGYVEDRFNPQTVKNKYLEVLEFAMQN